MPAQDYQIALRPTYSGNVTLNKLLRRGGFILPHDDRCGLVVVLRGKPGTGKSTLALQILDGLELRERVEMVQTDGKTKVSENVLPLRKYYCSVEQTVTDLHFKRLSMLVAQAILRAWEPNYEPKPDQRRLVCNMGSFQAALAQAGLKDIHNDAGFLDSIKPLIERIEIPLYEGPSDDHHVLPNEALEIAERILKWQRGACLRQVTSACVSVIGPIASASELDEKTLAGLPGKVGEEIAKLFPDNPQLGERIKGTISGMEFPHSELTKLVGVTKVALSGCPMLDPSSMITGQNRPRVDAVGHVCLPLDWSLKAWSESSPVQAMVRLLFECKMMDGDQSVCFRGLEDGGEAISADEPFGVGRSRSLGALRLLEAIDAELRSPKSAKDRERAKRPVVVIDGLSLLTNQEREMLEIQGIVDRLRRLSQMGIIVYEPNEDEAVNLDHHADMVIELQRKELKEPLTYLIHEICLKKARYQETALGQHQFKIRRSGLAFFPSVHFQIQHVSYMDFELVRSTAKRYEPSPARESVCLPSNSNCCILDIVFPPTASDSGNNGSQKGESLMLLGSRGTFKTELTLDFLARGSKGCPKGKTDEALNELEKGLLVSLIDNSPSVERGLWCPWGEARCGDVLCDGCPDGDRTRFPLKHARPFKQPPGCISSAEFLYYLEEVIDRMQPEQKTAGVLSRLVFWDLTQLDHRFPLLKADDLLLPGMIDIFKRRGIRSLFMGAEKAAHTAAASEMADNVLYCWRSEAPADVAKWKVSLPSARKDVGDWALHGMLMLYVDRAAASERPAAILYNIPIYRSKKSEGLLLPKTAEEMRQPPFKIELSDASGTDRSHITKLRRRQGLE